MTKSFKLVASKAGKIVFDDRVEAETPREAREKMRTTLGLPSLTGVVYAITEIPVELIREIVDQRLGVVGNRVQLHRGVTRAQIAAIVKEEVTRQFETARQLGVIRAATPATPSTP